MDNEKFKKLKRATMNNFITNNKDIYSFCLTPDCPSIIENKVDKYTCWICNKKYCNICKVEFHHG